MKIAICTKGNDLNAPLDERFGRSENYLIFDDQTNEFVVVENTAKQESSGAGGASVKILADNKVSVALSPHVGPKAHQALDAFEIRAFNFGDCKTVQEALDAFKNNSLKEITNQPKGLRKA